MLLYTADTDSDRGRYRGHRSSSESQIRWLHLPHDNAGSAHRSKVVEGLIQLVQQLLSFSSLPDSAHKAIREFVGREERSGDETTPLPNLPLTTLVYSNASLLNGYISLMNAIEMPPKPGRVHHQSSSSPSSSSQFIGRLFVDNVIDFVYKKCPDRTCFHNAVLRALDSTTRKDGHVSSLFPSFVSRMVSDMVAGGNHQHVKQFIEGGGVRVMVELLVRSLQPLSSPPPPSPSSSSSPPSAIINTTIHHVGQQTTTPSHSQELVNYLPLAKLRLSPGHAPLADLQQGGHGDPPSRSSSFYYTFSSRGSESSSEVIITATLPHPILLHSVQLFQPLGSLQNGPSSILVETASQLGLATPTPATPNVETKGLSCIKIEFHEQVIAQEVRVHLRRPAVSDSISLSHMYLMGVGYGGRSPGEVNEGKSEGPPSCSSWLAILDRVLDFQGVGHKQLVKKMTSVPQIVPTLLSLITTHYHTLS